MPESQEGRTHKPPSTSAGSDRALLLAKSYQIIWLLVGILEGLFGLRFLLKLIAANPGNAFAQLVYGLTDLFLAPFFSLTSTPEAGGMVLEVPTIIAMMVYALAGWTLIHTLRVLFSRPSEEDLPTDL
jgi:hypothetical protein